MKITHGHVNTIKEAVALIEYYMENSDTAVECEIGGDSVTIRMDMGCDEAQHTTIKSKDLLKELNAWLARYEPEVQKIFESDEAKNFPHAEFEELKKEYDDYERYKVMDQNKKERCSELREIKRFFDYPLYHEGVEAYIEQFLNETFDWEEMWDDEECEE